MVVERQMGCAGKGNISRVYQNHKTPARSRVHIMEAVMRTSNDLGKIAQPWPPGAANITRAVIRPTVGFYFSFNEPYASLQLHCFGSGHRLLSRRMAPEDNAQ